MPRSVSESEAAAQRLHLSITPFLRGSSVGFFGKSALPTILDQGSVFTTSGRAALALALRELGVKPGDDVLIPAYHCLALSSPIASCGAHSVFYRMTRTLSIDLDDLKSRITSRTRCIIAVHFFGFPESLNELRAHCDAANIALVEDCAHTFYGPRCQTPIGQTGDFTIGSLMKFFPLFDGGCLSSSRRKLDGISLRSRGLFFQLKALVHIIERSATYSRSRVARALNSSIARAISRIKNARPHLQAEIAQASPSAVFGSVDFQQEWADSKMSLASRLITRCVDHARVIDRRRANYLRYAAALANQPGGLALRPHLPDGVVPYVFPFVLDEPAAFDELRRAGVPMYRWEDVDETTCDVTRRYKYSLVQFPCHQELAEADLEVLIATIIRVLRERNAASAPHLGTRA